jgi:HK97 family phage prohead protease
MNELTRETTDAVLVRADDAPDDPDAGRHVRLRIMPWDVVANPKDTGPESFVRGAFDGIDATRVVIESGRHDGQLVGRGESLEELDDAAYLDTVIARTAAGDELLELARAGVYRDVSVAFAPVKDRRRGGVTERVRADLRRVAIVPRGTYPGAEVVHVRTEEEQTVTEQTIPAAPSLDDIGALVRGIVADAIPAPVVSIPALRGARYPAGEPPGRVRVRPRPAAARRDGGQLADVRRRDRQSGAAGRATVG